MLSEKSITRIAELAKVKPEDLKAAIADEKEVDVAIEEKLTVLTEPEITVLKNNEYKNGKEKGVEMAVKDTKEKLGLEFQGKTIDGLVEAAQKKALADAKIEPEKKVQELEGKIKTLQTNLTEAEQKLTEKDSEVQKVKIHGELYKHIPEPGENGPALSRDEVIRLMEANGYEFKNENGKVVPYKNGEAQVDKLANPVAVKDIVSGFLKEKKLVTEDHNPKGRGGSGSGNPTKYTKLSELKEKFTGEGKSLNGQEFMDAVTKARAEFAEFDMSA